MAEIHLPTKVTQDAIKQDTTEILSNFPISVGIDFSNYYPVVIAVKDSRVITNLTTIFQIDGGGYIDRLSIVLGTAQLKQTRWQLILDEEIAIDVKLDSQSDGATNIEITSNAIATGSLPWVATYANSIPTLDQIKYNNIGIFFKESLEIKVIAPYENGNSGVNFSGGVER